MRVRSSLSVLYMHRNGTSELTLAIWQIPCLAHQLPRFEPPLTQPIQWLNFVIQDRNVKSNQNRPQRAILGRNYDYDLFCKTLSLEVLVATPSRLIQRTVTRGVWWMARTLHSGAPWHARAGVPFVSCSCPLISPQKICKLLPTLKVKVRTALLSS